MPNCTDLPFIVVLMAKAPTPGRVKTRLIGPLTAQQAADIHHAMMECVISRLAKAFGARPDTQLLLAIDDPTATPDAAPSAPPPWTRHALDTGWRIIPQGKGDLGDRLLSVHHSLGGGPVFFFGVDSPDVPMHALRRLPTLLARADLVLGPVDDGGYWTIGLRRPEPRLFVGVDWGTAAVYHQTMQRAARCGLHAVDAHKWTDVDEPDDLHNLQARLAELSRRGQLPEPELGRLSQQLVAVTRPTTSQDDTP